MKVTCDVKKLKSDYQNLAFWATYGFSFITTVVHFVWKWQSLTKMFFKSWVSPPGKIDQMKQFKLNDVAYTFQLIPCGTLCDQMLWSEDYSKNTHVEGKFHFPDSFWQSSVSCENK